MSSRPTSTLAALRQLASLGLPGKAVLPDAIRLLGAAVGFEMAGAFHVNHRCRIVDAHLPTDLPPELLIDYTENFLNRPDGEGAIGPTTEAGLRSDLRTIHTSRYVDRRTLMRTEFWNRVLHPAGIAWRVRLPLRSGRLPLANVDLTRPIGTPDFSAADIRFLEQAQPWMCHALARVDDVGRADGEPSFPAGESSILILDAGGKILSASPGALTLLHQAIDTPLAPGDLHRSTQGDARTLPRRLARAVGASLACAPADLPAATIRNSHGFFSLRAYALDAFVPGSPLQVTLHIEKRMPLRLRLFRSPRFLALSPRERDVCLGLIANRPLAEIARQLGIKRSSVVHHASLLYQRLDIAGQKDLLPALLGETCS
jgi:DNA-binding CsgD family transcriptional regulator